MIVLDVETTGLNPDKNSIVSIGAVDFDVPQSQFYGECRVFNGAEVDQKALNVNGFTIDQVVDDIKPSHNDLISKFDAWYQSKVDRTLAGENVPQFDLPMLSAAYKRAGIDTRLGHRGVDMHSVFYVHLLQRGKTPPVKDGRTALGADSIFEYVGLYKEPHPHNALMGAKMEAEAFGRLINGVGLLQEFASFPVPDYLVRTTVRDSSSVRLP